MAEPKRPRRSATEPISWDRGPLISWAVGGAKSAAVLCADGLRFASYGRVSTEDRQNPALSRRWQDNRAAATIAGEGRIVRAFFDEGHSRQKAWQLRPAAAELIAALKHPDRGFDAVVIGSHERAFYGNQFSLIAPLFEKYGVQLWLPELGGPVDWNLIGHDELLTMLGMVAKREIVKIRARTTAAMTAAVRDFGRYVGGRPPYGYRLVDAGPHPNLRDARWGRRLLKLQADPQTAPIVTWIFQMRLSGKSVARIARALNEQDIPCPSAADRERNPHRSGEAWQVPAVSAILANPVDTGHVVWNRQFNAHPLVDEDDLALGRRDAQRWNSPDQ